MARLSRGRDHALLGHDPRDPFAGASPYRHPDVDFSDVFGGPPRRSSIGRTGLGPGESAGGRGGGVGEDEAAAPRRAWSCSHGEVPVFGGAESPARRSRPEGGGFFDDIFRVNELGCSSPRKVDRDVFSSNPSSGVLSPARPLPPASDVFVRGSASALPAQLRSVLGSSPVTSVPTSYRRLVQTSDNPKIDMELKKDASGVQTQSGYGYFHFSMHKWASVGVTLVSPYNLRGRTKSGTKASGLSIQLPQSADSPTDKCMPQGHGNLHTQCDLEHKSKLSGPAAEETCTVNLMREVKEGFPASSDTDSVRSHTTDKSGDIETRSKDGAGVPVKAWKPEPKNLSQLLNNFSNKQGDKQRTGQTRNDESMVVDHNTKMDDVHGTANVEQTISENMFGSHTGKYTKKIHDTSAAGEDKIVGSRVKGKVKAFIKIFNQEPAPRSDENIENQARKPKTGNEARGRLDAYVANADEHEKEKLDNETLATSPLAANQNVEIGDIPASDRILCMQKMDYSSSEAKGVSPDQIPATLDASFLNIEEPYIENIDECLVEDNQNEVSQVTEADVYQDEIKKSDAKIREWSRGKEGNIRSLLSTLQYVLWPGSGWRPVPLVDIIEGASVRKAYQKALLCLHPDKLQQKGAEMHQKYIAEKVFDILQEAWIHFNSVSSL